MGQGAESGGRAGDWTESDNSETKVRFHTRVEAHNAAPTVFVNDRPLFLNAPYLQKAPYGSFKEAKTGVYMTSDHAFEVEPGGEVRARRAVKTVEAILECEPSAFVIVRTFPPAPDWWLDQHPDEELAFDTDPEQYAGYDNYRDASWGSDLWLEAVCDWYRQFCGVLHERFRGQVIGYQFGMGSCGENNPLGACAGDGRWFAGDFSTDMISCFRGWLRERYEDEAELRSAWGSDTVTFETAEVPGRIERLRTEWFTFRDPRRRHVSDYYEAFADRVATCVIRICSAIKQATDNACLAGSHLGALMDNGFHGYLYHQTCINKVLRALEHPAVDTFTSPASYINRDPGGDASSMMPAGSYALRGKLIYQDQDTRTHHVSEDYRKKFTLGEIARNSEETVGVLKRDFAHMLIRGYGLWWHAMARGMYDEPSVGKCIARLSEMGKRSLHFPR